MVYGVLELGFTNRRLISQVPIHVGSKPFPGQQALVGRVSRIRSFGQFHDPALFHAFLPDSLKPVSILGLCGGTPIDLDAPLLSRFSSSGLLDPLSRIFFPPKLSPSHAVIVVDGDCAHLHSLSDKNVCLVSPTGLEKHVPLFDSTPISPSDKVRFGSSRFDFSVSVLTPRPQNHALLIGNRSDLLGVESDIISLSEALKLRGMKTVSLFPSPTKFDVCRAIYKLSESATSQSTTLVSFSGHGNSRGLTLSGNSSDSSILKASEFYALLDLIPGKKIIFLDACETLPAGFLYFVPSNCFVIVGQDHNFLIPEAKRPHIFPFPSDPWEIPLIPYDLEFGGTLTSALLANLAFFGNCGEIAAGNLASSISQNPILTSLNIRVICSGDPSILLPPLISLI